MTYRPEIDGLRALAIVPVLFSHSSIPFMSGGFVGADIVFKKMLNKLMSK